MQIVVLNGSPKGRTSITMQYVEFLEKVLPELDVKFINISQRIKKLERNPAAFEETLEAIRGADLVLWATHVYVQLVPAQYKRFIELIHERGAQATFEGRYTAALTTSIHWFDHTAQSYLRATCDDLKMRFVGSYSAGMHDLFKKIEQERLVVFARELIRMVHDKLEVPARAFDPLLPRDGVYEPGPPGPKADLGGHRVVIVTDRSGSSVGPMVDRLKAGLDGTVEIISLDELSIRGGCLGCLRCGQSYTCRWEGKDDFVTVLRERIATADAIVFAGAVVDRYLSSAWKQFFDRGFCNTHTPTYEGRQLAFLISGPLSQLPSLREIFEGYAQWQLAGLVDIVSDEDKDSARVDASIDALAAGIERRVKDEYIAPSTFLGVGGWKIFRDDIWGRLRFVFKADHEHYRRNGRYDFPQKDLGWRGNTAMMTALMAIPPIRRDIIKRIPHYMVRPYRKIIEKALAQRS